MKFSTITFKNVLGRLNHYVFFEIIILACLFANIIHTHQLIMGFPKFTYVIYPLSHLCFFLFEGFSIYLLSFIVPKYRHTILLVLYFIASIVLWINVAYSRYFGTYMPLTLYDEFNNLNGLLPNILDVFEWSDLFFIFTSTIAVFTYYKLGRSPKPRKGYILPLAILGITLIAFIPHYRSVKKDHDHLIDHFKDVNDKRTVWDIMIDRRRMMGNTIPKMCTFYYGIGLSLFVDGIESLSNSDYINFTEEEKKAILQYRNTSEYSIPTDTTENLIFILVESLSSFPINYSCGDIEITPNINKYLAQSYYFPNMKSEALLGESSDGQFIYLTGLLPLKKDVTINKIRAHNITTFVSMLKEKHPLLKSQMVIPTEKGSWSQESMCTKYSIDKLFSKNNYPETIDEDWLNDKQLFKFAQKADMNLKPPFVSFILTSSMHSPYIKSYEEYNIPYPKEFSSELRHYLDNVHYMDKYLGEYIEFLKKQPWYNDCTIIITADHKPNGPKLNVEDTTPYTKLPLIIINPPQEFIGICCDKAIAQTSIFPTVLDLFHIKSDWRGVGNSIFMPDSIHDMEYEQKRAELQENISDYIISSEYLK